MNERTQPKSLAEALPDYAQAFLLTASAHGGPHATAVQPQFEDGELIVVGLGRHSRDNVAARPKVALLWPPRVESGYSLVVDGDASVVDGSLRVAPTRAVLTRAAPAPRPAPPGACVSDCIELDLSGRPRPVARSA